MIQHVNSKNKYVVGLAFSSDFSGILLIRKTKPAWQEGKLNGIGGKVEEGETFIEAMVREFEEECGLKTRQADWIHLANFSAPESVVVFYFARLPNEFLENYKSPTEEQVLYCDSAEVMKDRTLIPNLRWLLPFATIVESAEKCGNSLTGVFT